MTSDTAWPTTRVKPRPRDTNLPDPSGGGIDLTREEVRNDSNK